MAQTLIPLIQTLTPTISILIPTMETLIPMTSALTPMISALTPTMETLIPMISALIPTMETLILMMALIPGKTSITGKTSMTPTCLLFLPNLKTVNLSLRDPFQPTTVKQMTDLLTAQTEMLKCKVLGLLIKMMKVVSMSQYRLWQAPWMAYKHSAHTILVTKLNSACSTFSTLLVPKVTTPITTVLTAFVQSIAQLAVEKSSKPHASEY